MEEATYCKDCKNFQPFDVSGYGACRLREIGDVVVKSGDYCSYAVPREPERSEPPAYDDYYDHDVSGLIDE